MDKQSTLKTNMFQMQLHDAQGNYSDPNTANLAQKDEQCRLDMDPRHSRRSVRFGESDGQMSPSSQKHPLDDDSEDPSDEEGTLHANQMDASPS